MHMHMQLDRTASKTMFTLGEIFHVFLVSDRFVLRLHTLRCVNPRYENVPVWLRVRRF